MLVGSNETLVVTGKMYSTKQPNHEASSYLAISASKLPSVRYGQSKVIALGPITSGKAAAQDNGLSE
jgi:ethanolamine ammonia-lyase large subunit